MNALEDIVDKDNWYYTIGGVWECVSASIDVEDAAAELAALTAELEQVKRERDEITRLAKEVNSLLNSTMSWMQEEGIEIPFVMSLMVGSLGEKSELLAAALSKAGQA